MKNLIWYDSDLIYDYHKIKHFIYNHTRKGIFVKRLLDSYDENTRQEAAREEALFLYREIISSINDYIFH